ncbi:hypothetical protein SAMN05421866_3341 [Chryseobacterium oranimense]|uniref:Uncharacterized protein n=1 Tax=Chryseobacterium oranimense TaxID=421058 RepID=A0A1M5UQR0_9FLAO|nr:hypothetical protein [Chryseobacterium oranimense]SHH65335.1 hypothetical protein SAMN05421866_3341 [Chryseobacterium oranimense]
MKQILFILLIFCTSTAFGQNKCTLKLESGTTHLQEKGIIELSVMNAGNKKVKINKIFSPYRLQLVKIREKENKIDYTADVDCFTDCIKKTVKLKPGESYRYTIPIRETIQYAKLMNGRTYSFHLFFDLVDLTPEDCNVYGLTDKEVVYTKVSPQ